MHFAVQRNYPEIVEFLLPYTDHLPFSAQNDYWGSCPFELALNEWNLEIVEIFAKFYKERQHRLNPTFFRDMANGRPNQGEIDDDFFDILTNLIRQEAFVKCRCKGPCEISQLVEFMLLDNDSEDSEYSDDDTEDSDCWETITKNSESEESEEEEIISEEYEKACKENPKLSNLCYLSIYSSLKKKNTRKRKYYYFYPPSPQILKQING